MLTRKVVNEVILNHSTDGDSCGRTCNITTTMKYLRLNINYIYSPDTNQNVKNSSDNLWGDLVQLYFLVLICFVVVKYGRVCKISHPGGVLCLLLCGVDASVCFYRQYGGVFGYILYWEPCSDSSVSCVYDSTIIFY